MNCSDKKLANKDRSTESMAEYIYGHLCYGFLSAFSLYTLLPAFLPVARYEKSVLKLVTCMLLMSAFGILLTYSKRRVEGIILDVVAGLGGYVTVTLGKYKFNIVKIIFCVFLCVTITSILIIFFQKNKRRNRLKFVLLRRLHRSLLLVRRNLVVALGTVLVVVPCLLGFMKEEELITIYAEQYSNGYEVQDYEIDRVYGDRYGLSSNLDVIKVVRNEAAWKKLNFQERCEVYRAVTLCEARYLGIPFQIELVFEDMKDEIQGSYSHSEKTIRFNSKNIMHATAEEALLCILHEIRHVYQHAMVELYRKMTAQERALLCFSDVKIWAQNFENYIVVDYSEESFLEYRNQAVEVDCENYARRNLFIYYKEIDELISNSNQ